MSDDKSCSKCGTKMERGFLVDLLNKNPVTEIAEQMTWVNGDSVERSSLTGGVKLKGKSQFTVTTFRCTGCGYLESYAAGTGD
jgi:predicted nucleic-acid-binding Zn-ribbon protein